MSENKGVYLAGKTMSKLAKLEIDAKKIDFTDLHPRIGVSVGISIGTVDAGWVKPGVSIEIDVPENTSIDDAMEQLTDHAMALLGDLEDKLIDYIS